MPFGVRPPVSEPPADPAAPLRGVARTRCGSCGSTFSALPPSSALAAGRNNAQLLSASCMHMHRI